MYRAVERFSDTTLLAEKDGRNYVLKEITADELEIFRRLKTLRHPNVAAITEITTISGKIFSVTEYTEGITVSEYVLRNGTFEETAARRLAAEICDGLEAIHSLGLIHRDINPRNVLITDNMHAVIIDFGIARISAPDACRDTQLLGTQGYASPEQYGFRQTDARSDIYSLGVLLNFMLTAKLPNEFPASGDCGRIILKCTELDPSERYSSASEVRSALIKRRRLYGIICKLPGFRRHILRNEIIASVYYICAGFFTLVMAVAVLNESLRRILCLYGIMLFTLWVPVAIMTDFRGILSRQGFYAKKSPKRRRLIRLLLCLLSLFAAFAFILVWQ